MIKSRLRILLAINEMNQKELAEKTGVRPQTITNIVNNKIKQIPVAALDSFCDVFNCQPSDLFEHVKNSDESAKFPQ